MRRGVDVVSGHQGPIGVVVCSNAVIKIITPFQDTNSGQEGILVSGPRSHSPDSIGIPTTVSEI